ncbi:MAG: DUF1080 domain-containing protein [Prolixibacteraceae bacterium]|nr:DUF1080 domain-containing protein [Prolixibacteraceae bacterium]
MKKSHFTIIGVILLFITNSCNTNKWVQLFNGENIDNWEIHIGRPLRGFDSLATVATPESVFSVVEENGEKLIRISGDVNASLATIDTFANYHLQFVFKWGENVYTSRNSGLLYHSFGDYGKALGTWMACIECQLMNDKLGDTYLMDNTYCETTVKEANDGGYIYSEEGVLTKFGRGFNGSGIQKAVDAKIPIGEWNTIELYSFGRTTVHVVNGKVTMMNTNTGKIEDGEIIPLSSGRIQIQSEGAELFVKSIQIKSLDEIPAELFLQNTENL